MCVTHAFISMFLKQSEYLINKKGRYKYMKEVIPGTMFQLMVDDEPKMYRAKRVYDSKIELVSKDGDKKDVSIDDLNNDGVLITPDAFVNMMIAMIDLGINDVYISVNKVSEYMNKNNNPSLLIRQNVLSSNKSNIYDMSSIYVGNCWVSFIDEDISKYIEIYKIIESYSVAYYIGDSQNDILSYVTSKFKNNVQGTLRDIKSSTDNKMIKGFSDSLSDLMRDNDFMFALYGIFNIIKIDFDIILGKQSYNEDGDIILNNKQIDRIQQLISKYITDVIVIKYDKDIDIKEIVTREHIMVADSTDTVYLIAYKVTGMIVDDNNIDVLEAMTRNMTK